MEESNEKITLIRDQTRIDVHKEKLSRASRYFFSLFSHGFNDSRQKEHTINYDIPIHILQEFVKWVQDEDERVDYNCHSIRASMLKFTDHCFSELLDLLKLSVLFTVDGLLEEATDIIVLGWLLPDKVIDIWLLAQELNISALRDVCLSVCLDRFENLPMPSLVELSKENILELVGNNNVRSTREYLLHVWNEWIKYNKTNDVEDVVKGGKSKIVQGIVVYKKNPTTSRRMAYVYTWDGATFSELVQVKDLKSSDKEIIGMQVTARGFNIYIVGGERGLGTNNFNNVIWRYCLISKKWYYQARMPVPRRNAVVEFLENKLLIVGGVGLYRMKQSTVDILDIHTGAWSVGERVPEGFTEVPPHCVLNGKLYLKKSNFYIYDPLLNRWDTIEAGRSVDIINLLDWVFTPGAAIFVTGNRSGETILSRIEAKPKGAPDEEDCLQSQCKYIQRQIWRDPHTYETCVLVYSKAFDIHAIWSLVHSHRDESWGYFQSHTEIRRDLDDSSCNPKLGYFSLIHSENLRDTS